MVGVGDGDELHRAEPGAQVALDVQAGDGEVRRAFQQYLLDAGQHLLAQAHAAAAALRHEGGEGAHQAGIGIGGVHHQAHLGFPALFHVVGQFLELAGLLDQLPGAAQQHLAGLGQYRLAAFDAQQGHAELFLHARDRVAHRGLRAVGGFGRLGEATVIHHCLQGSPLVQGYARGFHALLLL
ncbi:hypothetical protein FQZ97_693000 [compost metagenome]